MRVNGQMITCDRCGKTTFRKLVCEDDGDGGFTRVPRFEDAPNDWMYSSELESDLCPECAKKWERVMTDFFKDVKTKPTAKEIVDGEMDAREALDKYCKNRYA